METVSLGDVAEVFNGKTPSKTEKRSEGHPILKIKDVTSSGEFCGDFDSFVDRSFAKKYAKKSVQTHDVMVLNAAHNADYVGSKIYKASSEVEGAIATGEWLLARATSQLLDQSYLWHWFQAPQTRFEIRKRVKGIHLYPRDVAELTIPLPPIDKQRRIAAILDIADGIRRKREHARKLSSDLMRSVFLDMFGDPATNPHDFKFDEVAAHLSKERAGTQSGPFGSALKKHEYVNAGIPVWGVDSVQQNEFVANAKLFITDEKFEQLERYQALPGDVLISRAGTVGRMCIAKPPVDKSIISTNLVRVVLDNKTLLPEYFVALFTYVPHRLGALKANNKDNAFTFLNPKTLRGLKIPIPPIDQQLKFKRMAEKTESEAEQMNRQLQGFDQLFSSLAQLAFRGEL